MTALRTLSRIRIPSDLVLTSRVLAGAMRRLPTREIEKVVYALIDELDDRHPDPDQESDADCESDPDLEAGPDDAGS